MHQYLFAFSPQPRSYHDEEDAAAAADDDDGDERMRRKRMRKRRRRTEPFLFDEHAMMAGIADD